jgi:hypothetical protein
MAICMLMDWSGLGQADYDAVMEALGLDAEPPAGALFHVAGADGDTWRVLDIWESEDAWNTFLETRLKAAFGQAGLADRGQPNVRIFPVHNVYAPGLDELGRLGSSSLAVR